MEVWMVWTLAVPLIVVAASLLLLALLLALNICKIVAILRDIEDKLHALNPLCRIVHRVGAMADEKIEAYFEHGQRSTLLEVAEWVMSGLSLFKNYRRK